MAVFMIASEIMIFGETPSEIVSKTLKDLRYSKADKAVIEAARRDPKFYTLKEGVKVKIEEVEEDDLGEVIGGVGDINKVNKGIEEVAVAIDKIINIGSKIWDMVISNKPVVKVRLSWGDMYEMRKELAKILSEKYGAYTVNVVIDAVGEFIFSNFEYFSPFIALSGPAGFVVLSGLPIAEETFQCNISVKNILLKGGLSAGMKVVLKVPIIKSDNVAGVFAERFIKSAAATEVSKWVKHFFGDGLEVEKVSVVKQYGKEFALITLKSALGTGQHYSNK